MLYQGRCTKDDVQCTMYNVRCIPLGSPTNFNSRVELAGVEPASKQGPYMLSTRLSWPSFSSDSKTQATNYRLIC